MTSSRKRRPVIHDVSCQCWTLFVSMTDDELGNTELRLHPGLHHRNSRGLLSSCLYIWEKYTQSSVTLCSMWSIGLQFSVYLGIVNKLDIFVCSQIFVSHFPTGGIRFPCAYVSRFTQSNQFLSSTIFRFCVLNLIWKTIHLWISSPNRYIQRTKDPMWP